MLRRKRYLLPEEDDVQIPLSTKRYQRKSGEDVSLHEGRFQANIETALLNDFLMTIQLPFWVWTTSMPRKFHGSEVC